MALLASDIVEEAAKLLYDPTYIRWTEAELLDYLNAAISAVLVHKPDAYIVDAAIEIEAGSRQTIPADGVEFIEAVRNEGADGDTPGAALRKVDMNFLNHNYPEWHTTSGTSVKHYSFDPRNPKVFYIYPFVNTTHYIRINYTGIPDLLTSVSDPLPISDIYRMPLLNFVLAYAHAKNFKAGDMNKWVGYLTRFNEFFGIKTQTQTMFRPIQPEQENVNG